MRKLLVGAVGGVAAFLTLATAVSANGYNLYTNDLGTTAAASSVGLAGAGFSLVLSCCLLLVFLLVPIILAIVVYKDATKNHVENAVLWAILTLFFNVVGLLVYYLAIKPEAVKKLMDAPKSDASKK